MKIFKILVFFPINFNWFDKVNLKYHLCQKNYADTSQTNLTTLTIIQYHEI